MIRWGLNLALAIIDDVLCCKSNLNSEDLVLVNKFSYEISNSVDFLRVMKCPSAHLCVITFLSFSNIVKVKSPFDVWYEFSHERISPNFFTIIQDELRRKHFNAVQKLRVSQFPDLSEEKARLEQEILSNSSGMKTLSKRFFIQ